MRLVFIFGDLLKPVFPKVIKSNLRIYFKHVTATFTFFVLVEYTDTSLLFSN